MYKVFKTKGHSSNITIINEKTTSSVVLGRFNMEHKAIFDKYDISTPSSIDEWSFEVEDEIGKELVRTMMTMRKPIRTIKTKAKEEKMRSMNVKIDESEQITPDATITPESKCNAYDYLFGYTDELDD